MKSKKDLSPRTAGAGMPVRKDELRPGEATAARFKLVSKEELEATRCKAYAYVM